jgi:4-amino-4-deoxy-L-arabinose transferase-like glycosyltransferase
MIQKYWSPLLFTFLWLILVAVAIATRPALPVDETRYLAVAWEMWTRGDFLVPHLNGETYSHKPPLLFWAMNVGWAVFGVNDWWPPMVAPLFGLACLFLTRAMTRKLWPDEPLIADLSPLVLLGAAFWTVFTTVTMFDMLVAACTLWGLLGLLMIWRDGDSKGWWHLGLAIGFGILAKGPVILLQILPIALLAPVWDCEGLVKARFASWKGWYLRILLAVLGGAVIGLSWAVPAGMYGGEAYRNAIFWGQTAGRVVDSFAHARAWWWYLAVIGPLLLPWVIWPTLWRSLGRAGFKVWSETQSRFCIFWFVPIFVAFSLISGKQLHYLLPIFPAFAIFLTRLFVQENVSDNRLARLIPAGLMIVVACILMAAPYLGIKKLPDWALDLPTYWMVLPMLAGLVILVKDLKGTVAPLLGMMSLMISFVVALHLSLAPYLAESFDLHDMSRKIKTMQDEGYDIGFVGNYHGTFQFLGRLKKPITELATNEHPISVEDWVGQHPKSKMITVWKQPAVDHKAVDFTQDFRSGNFIIFDVQHLAGDLFLLERRGK